MEFGLSVTSTIREYHHMSSTIVRKLDSNWFIRTIIVFFLKHRQTLSPFCYADGIKGKVFGFKRIPQESWAIKRLKSRLKGVQFTFYCIIKTSNIPSNYSFGTSELSSIQVVNLDSKEAFKISPNGVLFNPRLQGRLTICAPTFFGNPPYLKEWLEYHRNKYNANFIVYKTFKVSKEIESLLKTYEVKVVEWNMTDLKTYDMKPRMGSDFAYRPSDDLDVSYYGQYGALQDCVTRSMGSKWVKTLDLDEFLDGNITTVSTNMFHNHLVKNICRTYCKQEPGQVPFQNCDAKKHLKPKIKYYKGVLLGGSALLKRFPITTIGRHAVRFQKRNHNISSHHMVSWVGCNQKNKRQELEFIHIMKTGGSFIEKLGAMNNFVWGACHFSHQDYRSHKCPGRPDLQGKISVSKYRGSKWHIPIQYWIPNAYKNSKLFTIVRNPYTRMISMYYDDGCGYQGQDKNNAIVMNQWIQRFLIKGGCSPVASIPQYEYVFDGNKRVVDYVLHHETLNSDLQKLFQMFNLDIYIPDKKVNERTNSDLTYMNLDKKSIGMINKKFENDFDEFGYNMIV